MTRTTASIAALAMLSGCSWFVDEAARAEPRIAIGIGTGKVIAAQSQLSDAEEEQAGARMHPIVVSTYGDLSRHVATNAYVADLGQRLVTRSRRPGLPWRFFVLRSWERNALCAPGGRVYVTLGLLHAVRSEAELAGLLAHEIGHIEARHPGERIRRIRTRDAVIEAANRVADSTVNSWLPGVIGTFADDYLLEGLPVEHQVEADRLAMTLLAKHNIGACGLRDLLRRLPDGPRKKATLHRTHRTAKRRLEILDVHIKAACPPASPAAFAAMKAGLPRPAARN